MAMRYLVDGARMERTEIAPRLVELLSRRSVSQVLVKGDRFSVVQPRPMLSRTAAMDVYMSVETSWA